MRVPRHRTALRRKSLSRPVELALRNELIPRGGTVFDYGCGHGGDVSRLRRKGFEADGWDPVHRPDARRKTADVVNLGYVVNVVEDLRERQHVLREAWSLARRVLIVSAQLTHDANPSNLRSYRDGVLTSTGTFQKYYEQQELSDWTEATLGEEPVTLAPGVLAVFVDFAQREAFVAKQYRRRFVAPTIDRADRLFVKHADQLQPLLDFLAFRGRAPRGDERANFTSVESALGSLRHALLVLQRVLGSGQWDEVRRQRSDDLLVYLALSRLGRPLKFSSLPLEMRYDVKEFFGSFRGALETATAVLHLAGRADARSVSIAQSTVGKRMPSAIYVHRSAVELLPKTLRVVEGCGRRYLGDVDDTNLVKIYRDEPKLSYLAYPEFDSDPHPQLANSVSVSLQTFRVRERNYEESSNPPVLHRKEDFVSNDYPGFEKFSRLTAQEERWGLYEDPASIGLRNGWLAALRARGATLRGHRLVKAKRG